MAETAKRTVRKGRIHQVRIGDVDYRAFIWQTGKSYCGRVEDLPQIPQCRGRSEVEVREQLSQALIRLPPGER